MEEMLLVVASHPVSEQLQFTLDLTEDPQDPKHLAEICKALLKYRPDVPLKEWTIESFKSAMMPMHRDDNASPSQKNEDEDFGSPAAKRPPVSPCVSKVHSICDSLKKCSPFKRACEALDREVGQAPESEDWDDPLATPLSAFDDDELVPSLQERVFPPQGCEVIVSGLSPPFMKAILESVIDAHLRKTGDLKAGETAFLNVQEYNAVKGTVAVEFTNGKLAQAACGLDSVYYLTDKVTLTMIQRDVIHSKPRVTVSNISPPFMQNILVSVIEAHLTKSGDLQAGDTAIVKVEGYDADKGTVVVEFTNEKLAQAACVLNNVYYLTDKVTLTIIQGDVIHAKPLVTVSNISPPFIQNIFVSVIEANLTKLGDLKAGNTAIVNVQEYNANMGTVVVEFTNRQMAQAACVLDTIYYLTDKVTFAMVETDMKVTTVNHDPLCQEPEKPSQIPVSLDSMSATLAYLQECVVIKGYYEGPFRGTEAAMRKIVVALEQNHNICVSVEACKLKKKRLDELHRRNPHHQWSAYMSFLHGATSQKPTWNSGSTNVTHASDESRTASLDVDVMAATKFVKGAVMSHAAVLSLIDIWMDKKEEYLKPHKDNAFYRDISTQMVLRGHYFSPDQCKNKTADLLSGFKEYVNSLKRTGNGRQVWRYYEPLRPLLDNLVTVEAQQTFAVGAAVVATQNNRLKPHANAESERVGRLRPSPTSAAREDKKAMMQLITDRRREFMKELKEVASAFQNSRNQDRNNNAKYFFRSV